MMMMIEPILIDESQYEERVNIDTPGRANRIN